MHSTARFALPPKAAVKILRLSYRADFRAVSGRPARPKVTGEIVQHGKDQKIYVFKFKRRKNYRRKTGHRQKHTEVKITALKLG